MSDGKKSSVYRQGHAVDVRRHCGCEKYNGSDKFLRLTDATERVYESMKPSKRLGSSRVDCVIGVSMTPGAIALTRIPSTRDRAREPV